MPLIRYMSDLHLEFIRPAKIDGFLRRISPPSDPCEICVLAGDIGNPYSENYDTFMKHISQKFQKIFVIAGNHEYYQSKTQKTIEETDAFLRDYMEARHPNISFLNNSCEVYENTCFIGTTLWSKITQPQYEINDVYKIPDFDYIKYNRLNRIAVDFLESAISDAEQDCVIITHHVPSNNLIDPKYKTESMRPYNQWFYCDMDDFIQKHNKKIGAWIYGHTHTPSCTTLHGVPMLCNPIGYPGENPWRADIGAFYDF